MTRWVRRGRGGWLMTAIVNDLGLQVFSASSHFVYSVFGRSVLPWTFIYM
jgi:hypothetical protein